MRTKDFCAAIEAGFRRAYDTEANFMSVPFLSKEGEPGECLGCLLAKSEHFAVVVAHAAHYIAEDPDNLFQDPDNGEISNILDLLEDFQNLVAGFKAAPYMQWTCVYFPGLTEEQVLGVETNPIAGSVDPQDGSFIPS